MVRGRTRGSWVVPVVAAVLAAAYLAAATVAPGWLAPVAVGAALGGCGLVLARRPSRRLAWALAAIGVWLCGGITLAWWLRSDPSGLLWVAVVVFLLPLPVVPWLYARTFQPGPLSRTTDNGQRTTAPSSSEGPQ